MLSKFDAKLLEGAQNAASLLMEDLRTLQDLRDELEEKMEAKGEKAQETAHEKYPWLQDFLEFDFSSLSDDLEEFANLPRVED